MTKGNYDKVAPYYDFLSHLIYGDAIDKANAYLVSFIPPQSSVLIIGGGTGKILQQIGSIQPFGLKIYFVEKSGKMIGLANNKDVGANEVTFINDAIENVSFAEVFDVVITPFLFDNFSYRTAEEIFFKTDKFLKREAMWLFADFRAGTVWQAALLKLMYLFFRLTCNIEAKQLPDISLLFKKAGYELINRQSFFSDFIFSEVYDRSAIHGQNLSEYKENS